MTRSRSSSNFAIPFVRLFAPDRQSYEELPREPDEIQHTSRHPSAFTHLTWAVSRRKGMVAALVLIVLLSAAVIGLLIHVIIVWKKIALDDYQILNTSPLVAHPIIIDHATSHKRALVTTLYSNDYAIAAAVLGHSAKAVNISAQLIILYLKNQVSEDALCLVRAAGWKTIPTPFISPPNNGEGVIDFFMDQYTKLNVWGLDKLGFEHVVYADADTLVFRNFDELFTLPWGLAVVPDVYATGPVGFKIEFNAGVLALRPDSTLLADMVTKLDSRYDRGQAEQAFLNLYYGAKAIRLPYAYNANLAIKLRAPILWQELRSERRIAHYTMIKPFRHDRSHRSNKTSNAPGSHEEVLRGIQNTIHAEGGIWKEEVEDWAQAYQALYSEKGSQMELCRRSS